jgi:ornithine--oxo-acid transaminase
MWAVEHWGAEPDMILMAKALSGGFVPVGAVGMRKEVFDKLFSSMIRAPIHGSTFSKNNLAMAAGIATLRVLREENLVEHAAKLGEGLIPTCETRRQALSSCEVRGRDDDRVSSASRAACAARGLEAAQAAQPGLFSQMIKSRCSSGTGSCRRSPDTTRTAGSSSRRW